MQCLLKAIRINVIQATLQPQTDAITLLNACLTHKLVLFLCQIAAGTTTGCLHRHGPGT